MIILYIGAKHSGKTTWLKKQLLRLEVVGVLMPQCKQGKEVAVLPSNNTYDLKPVSEEDTLKVGRFAFSKMKFDQISKEVITLHGDFPSTVLIIDEVGPLELAQSGFWQLLVYGIQSMREGKVKKMVCVVRDGLQSQVNHMIEDLGYDGVVAQIVLQPVGLKSSKK